MATTDVPPWWSSLDRSSGRQEFIKHIRHLVKEDASNFLYTGSVAKCIYQLVAQTVQRRTVKLEAAVNVIGEIAYLHHDMPGIILDVYGIFDAETSTGGSDTTDERNVFCAFVKETEKFLSENMLKERLEIDTLQDVGTVKNRSFYTRFIKVKTKLYYKQRRFNLFREESEGYAKLITELNQDVDNLGTSANSLEVVKSLIGCFNLDPNRVLDIILESFEMHPDRGQLFIPLLRNYGNDGKTICEVLGAKFRHYMDHRTPSSLFTVTAILLQGGLFDVEDIYSWLGPDDATLATDWKAEIAEAKEFVRKLNVVSINKKEDEDEEKCPEDRYPVNQKWRLVEALLGIGDWENANLILKKLPEHSVLVHEPVARSLCALLNVLLEPLYRIKCPLAGTGMSSSTALQNSAIEPSVISVVTTVNKLPVHVIPMFIALGPSLQYDPVLLHKLVNLLKAILVDMNVDAQNPPGTPSDAELYQHILTLLDSAVLPALSYMDCNCCLAEEIWEVIKFLPYELRYCLYGRWKNDTYQIHPKLIRRRGLAQKRIKDIMKRVSKENVKPVGRQIGKLSHCSPGFLFDYILLQIQLYDNLIGPVVESLRYLTSLSYDVLGYCLIETLAQSGRARLEGDGTSLSPWLQSLANFCGVIFKKYNIELNGLLQYVANQLKGQKSLDLLILKEILQKMTGVEAAEEMTPEQVRAMSGGEVLRAEAGYFSQVRNTRKSSQRLKDALAVNDLAVALALLIAQQKHCVIYHETTQSHLKLVGKLYDQCQDTLVQFGTFLGSNYTVEEYTERLPSIHAMLQEYHIHADVAFFLARPMLAHAITQKFDQLRKADAKKLTSTQKLEKYMEATKFVMDPIGLSVRPIHRLKVWDDISPQFLCTFWSLSMYDLQVPTDTYTKEINKLKQQSIAIMDNKEANASKNKKDQERFIALMEKLQDERKKQQEHVDKIMYRLEQEKESWFVSRSARTAKNESITLFLQLCLFPRCTFNALDALYCAKFVQIIHGLKTPNFATLLCYDRILCDITLSVASCTENEATRYGRFLCAMLETVMRWHMDEATFNKECANYPGFVTKFRVSNSFSEDNDHVNYENYRHVCHKWHYKITKAIIFCLDSKDYMQIRNALIILMRIIPHFPVIAKLANIIERRVDKVREDEKNKRQDLFVLASSYIGQLKVRASQMMREGDFHQVGTEKVAASAVPASAKSATTTTAASQVVSSNDDAKKPDATNKVEISKVPAPPKDTKVEKKLSRQPIKPPSPPAQVIDLERTKEKSPSPILVRESSVASTKSSSRESKKAERREKERDEDRKREKRRKRASPDRYADYYSNKNDDVQLVELDRRDRLERELSSVSNSSNGSPIRVMEPPETVERESKRRKIEAPKKSDSGGGSKREKSSKNAKRDKDNDDAKEIRREKRKKDRDDGPEKRLRRDDEKGQHKNGNDEPSPRISSKHHHRDVSPYDRDEHEPREKYKSRNRSGY